MVIQIKSDWMIPQVETLKVLNNLSNEKYNKNLKVIQYTDKKKKKTLLVVAGENGKPRAIDIKFARVLKTLLDETEFNQVFVFGETQTASAHNLLRYNKKARVSTSKMRIRLRTEEILEAFTQISESMCGGKCNNEDITECKSSKGNSRNCEIRTLLDNAIFHARMGWKDQLLQEFTHLMELKQEMQTQESN